MIATRIILVFLAALAQAGAALAWTHGTAGGGSTLPTVTKIQPQNGGSAGGTPITITGTNFTGATVIHFGATAQTVDGVNVTVVNPTTITVLASSAGSSVKDVTVTTPSGTSPTTALDQFTYSDFTQAYTAVGFDPSPGGTEVRNAAWHVFLDGATLPDGTTCAIVAGCHVFFMTNGFWEDSVCAVTPSSQGPQVLALQSTFGAWTKDYSIPVAAGFCNGDRAPGANFDVANSEYDWCVSYDGSGSPLNPCTDILVVAGTVNVIYVRDDVTAAWKNYSFGSGAARAMSDHLDTSGANPIDYLLMGSDTVGIYQATFLAWPGGVTINATSEPYSQNGATAGTCRSVSSCTNRNTDWAWDLTITGTTGGATTVTVSWASGSAMQVPSNLGGEVQIVGNTNCSPSIDGLQTVTASTATSITFAPGNSTTCTGTANGLVMTPAQLQLGFGAYGAAVSGSVTIAGITGYIGADPNTTFTLGSSNSPTKTSFIYTTATDCSGCSGGTVTTSAGTESISWPSSCNGPPNCTIPGVRVVGIVDCPVNSGGNANGYAAFQAMQFEIWERVDAGASSWWKLKGVAPYPQISWPVGQPQLRGLSCIPDSTKSPTPYALISHIEGDGSVMSMDTNTGAFNVEANLVTTLTSQWGNGAYGIHFYNSQGVTSAIVGPSFGTTKTYQVAGEGDVYAVPATRPGFTQKGDPSNLEAVTGFFVRSTTSPASPSAPSYTAFPPGTNVGKQDILNNISSTTPIPPATEPSSSGWTCSGSSAGPCPVMVSTRVGPFVSQFPEDLDAAGNGQAMFFCGFDANATLVHNTAWCGRAPLSMFSWP